MDRSVSFFCFCGLLTCARLQRALNLGLHFKRKSDTIALL
jgi:hypothetical protein